MKASPVLILVIISVRTIRVLAAVVAAVRIRLAVSLIVIVAALTAACFFPAAGLNDGLGNQPVSADFVNNLLFSTALCRFFSDISVIVV